MKLKHHIIRKFNDAKQAPLWKWILIIFLIIAMPLFFSYARTSQMQQVIEEQAMAPEGNDAT